MRVNEWMTPNPVTASSKLPVLESDTLLRERGFRRLPIVDNGVLVGIVTDRDLKNAAPSQATSLSIYELNYLLSKLLLKDVMKRPVSTVAPDDPIEVAATLMEEKKFSGLPVVSDGQVVGIITITDILRAFLHSLELEKGKALAEPVPG